MATKQPGVWGIDLGQCALKAIRLEKIDGQVTATAFDYVEHPKILSQPDADPDQLIREALEKFLSRNELRGDTIAISVPGQSGLTRFVKLPPVEEKKITDIVRFEAKQQIPFPLDEVVWDFQKIGSGVVTDGFALETEIGLFAMKRDLVNRYLQHFKDVGVEVHIVQMAPLALCNYVSHDLISKPEEDEAEDDDEAAAGKKKCVVALDIGADSSNLVITDGERIIWQRPIPLGGNHFTRALTKDLKLTFAKAEHVKRNAVKSPDLRKILASLKPVLNDFVSEAQRSLGYFTNTHRDAHVQYMIGLGNAFRLPGLQKYLQEKLQLEVRRLQRFNRMTGDAVTAAPQFTENIPSFAVAYGLALQGLGEPRLQTNLLPHEIRFERMVRAKKPWAAAAVAALVLAIAGLAFGRATEWRAVHNAAVDKALAEGKRVKDAATRIQTAYNENQQKVIASDKAVKNISGGVDERFNWNLFYKYVNDALPQPFGNKRLAERARSADEPSKMYDTPEAKAAFQEWLNKQFVKQGAPVLKAEKEREIDAKIKDNLIQINIVSINQKWEDDLLPFYKKIIADAKDRPAILAGLEEWEKQDAVKEAPEKLPKSGWVIEIRGSTYHQGGDRFVLNTLLENLARPNNVGNNYEAQATKLLAQLKQADDRLKALREQVAKAGAKKDESAEPKKEPKADPKKAALEQQIKRKEEERQDLEQQWKIADQLKKGVQDRKHFTILYRADTVRASAPPLGSVLPDVLSGGKSGPGADGKGPNTPTTGKTGGPPTGPGAPGAEDSSSKGADRSGWVPLGDIAAGVLGGSGGFIKGNRPANTTPPAGTGAEAPAAGPGQAQRVEFSILLVWQEPLPAGEAAPETPTEPKQ